MYPAEVLYRFSVGSKEILGEGVHRAVHARGFVEVAITVNRKETVWVGTGLCERNPLALGDRWKESGPDWERETQHEGRKATTGRIHWEHDIEPGTMV